MSNQIENDTLFQIDSLEYLDNITGLDQAAEYLQKLSVSATNALQRAEDKLFIAERIHNMLRYFLSNLEKSFETTTNEEIKSYIALILYTNNVGGYDSYLIASISEKTEMDELLFLALMKLASQRSPSGKIIIEKWIEKLQSIENKNELYSKYLIDLNMLLGKYSVLKDG